MPYRDIYIFYLQVYMAGYGVILWTLLQAERYHERNFLDE
jgi:hypothetical protein